MTTDPPETDVVVIGAGIVGLATARALVLSRPGTSVTVLDKESRVAAHQTGHNSGVVHSGIYYRPGSLKARLVAAGRAELADYCARHDLVHERCGKVVVATSPSEAARLDELAARGAAHGVRARRIGPGELRELEPHVRGVAALHVPDATIVDYAAISRRLADEARAHGEVRTGARVVGVRTEPGRVVVDTTDGPVRARAAVNCAGLHADRIAEMAGARPAVRIVPFRGEYHELVAERRHLARNLVYPVPDPRFPFLGVHLTRMVDGAVHAGPNAVLALAREGYTWGAIDGAEVRALAASPGLRRLARRYWRTGAGEVLRSWSTSAMVRALRRLVPDLERDDLVRAGSGVRAQALSSDGTLVDDFVVERTARTVHVLNAPSPAATASLAIGRHIAELCRPILDDEDYSRPS